VEWEFRVGTAESSNEVVFECTNGTFSGVAAVNVGGNELVINLFRLHEFFEHRRGFIVKTLHFWFEARLAQSRMANFVCLKDGCSRT
jgi:hypothetical protein